MYFFYQRQLLGCDCKQQCSEEYYSKTVSQSLWPSEVYLKHLLKSIHNINKKTNGLNDMASVRENIARLSIYFEELNFESTVQEPAYQVESLFSDIGGTAGLYIGISFISFCEFLELLFQLVKQMKRYHSVGAKNSRCDDLTV
ncbi:degenerin unc-8-like [Antedon mediterranea]|uniref:degenerin unc-8-like n=1 Tax=Antedon mediterranea TaxID=105859 RepID=UPI003AF58C7C